MIFQRSDVTSVILAGGRGVRMGGNKGLQELAGKSLIAWVMESVRRDSSEVMINANDALDDYEKYDCRVIVDTIDGWQGPLAGLQAALISAQTDYVLTVPCDTPFLPRELINRLWVGLDTPEVEAVVAVTEGHRQPTVALYRKNVLPKLLDYMDSGGRKVNDWLDSLQLSEVVFDNAGEFDNINTREDLARASRILKG